MNVTWISTDTHKRPYVWFCYSKQWGCFCISTVSHNDLNAKQVARNFVAQKHGLAFFTGNMKVELATKSRHYTKLLEKSAGAFAEPSKQLAGLNLPYCRGCAVHNEFCGRCNNQHLPAAKAVEGFFRQG